VCGAPIYDNCTHGITDPQNPGMFLLGGGHIPKTLSKEELDKWLQKEKDRKEEHEYLHAEYMKKRKEVPKK